MLHQFVKSQQIPRGVKGMEAFLSYSRHHQRGMVQRMQGDVQGAKEKSQVISSREKAQGYLNLPSPSDSTSLP